MQEISIKSCDAFEEIPRSPLTGKHPIMQFNDQDLARLKQRLHQRLTEEPQLDIVEVKLEQHSGTILAFRKDTDQFLGQGADREDLIKRLTENLTPCKVIIAQEDGADLLQERNT